MKNTRPPFSTFPILETENYLLREMIVTDAEDALAITVYDAKVAQDIVKVLEIQAKIRINYEKGEGICWGVMDKKTNKILANCSFHGGFEGGIGEIGCILKEEARGKGIMREVLQEIIDFGFKKMNLNEIIAYTNVQNAKATSLLLKLSFRLVEELADKNQKYSLLYPYYLVS